ncbi:MAG: glycosyltransferase [Chlorobiales bacterium]|nr:glycosyltransferase [Chlorobiales bacterium]
MQLLIITLLFLFLGLYLLKSFLFIFGYLRPHKTKKLVDWPRITVIVACRNEEKNIENTLRTLVALDYPKDKLEIIISDGASEDRTCEIVSGYARQYSFVRLLHADQNRSIKGKANAIHQAVEIAHGAFILMTDADCLVEASWAKETVRYFTDDVGLVCGITIPDGQGTFAATQAIDWAYILGTSSAVASLGYPIGGIGNNFSFRKETYDAIGGYANLPFSVTEDFSLFQAISHSRWKIVFPVRYQTCNITAPMTTLAELYEQKKRWTLGGLGANTLQTIMATVILIVHLITLAAILALPIEYGLLGLVLKGLSDFLVVIPVLKQLRKQQLLWAFPLFELYFYIYIVLVPLILLFSRKVVWKGISYHVAVEKTVTVCND